MVDGPAEHGWFVQDFDLAELRRLRARERWPGKRLTSAMYDGQAGVLTLEELLDLREAGVGSGPAASWACTSS